MNTVMVDVQYDVMDLLTNEITLNHYAANYE